MLLMENLQAVFFDFDGVLIDSTPTKTNGFRQLFSNCENDKIQQIVAYHQLHGGISRVEKIIYAYENILKQPLSDELLKRKAAEYSNLVLELVIGVPWISGAREFLDEFHRRLPLFVISGTPHDELLEIIERRGMNHYFNGVYGSPRRKPELVNELLDRYGLTPHGCSFIGDALTDYDTAVETGLKFIGIEGDVEFPGGTTVLPDCSGLESALKQEFIMPC